MILQATSFSWDRKFMACETVKEKNELILRSGKETAALRIDMVTKEKFYRPAIGKFIIHGLTEKDDFKFTSAEEAQVKGLEMRQLLIDEMASFDSKVTTK